MTAALVPNGKQQFIDINGKPLVGGTVGMYIVGTLIPKNTWEDPGQIVLNTNPVILDSLGQALIYGIGLYRQIVKDETGNLIWDQLTTASGGTASVDTIADFRALGSVASTFSPIYVEGYYSVDDGGEGIFVWSATNSSADNGGTIINPTGNVGTGRWLRETNGIITVAMFGAKGDGTTNDAPAFQAAAAAMPNGFLYANGESGQVYILNSTVSLGDSTHAIGLLGLGGVPTLKAGSSFSSSADLLTVGNGFLVFRPIIQDINLDANGFARRCLTMFAAQSPTIRRVQVSNALLENVAFTVSGGLWIERLLIEQCDWQNSGSDQILWSLAGSGDAFINEVVMIDYRLSGCSKLQSGGHQMRFTSTASGGGSTFTNFVFIKPHFDAQFMTGQAGTPSVDAINCDSGSLSNVTFINPQVENTGSASLGAGYVINKSSTGVINGVSGIAVSNNSSYATRGISPSVTSGKWDSYSFNTDALRGPVSTNGLSGLTASLAGGASANLFTVPVAIGTVYLVTATGGNSSPSYAASALIATDGSGTWNVAYISGAGTHIQFIGSGTTLTIKNVDLGANTLAWSAIRQL